MLRLLSFSLINLVFAATAIAGGNQLYVEQLGDNAVITVQQQGQDHTATITADGNNNSVQLLQDGQGHTSNLGVLGAGANNSINVVQKDPGAKDALVTVRPGRDGNTVNLVQEGNTGQRASVSIYSNNNTININQSGTQANDAYVLFSTNSTGPTDFTLNQTAGTGYGNNTTGTYVTQTCMNPAGCSVIVNQQ